MQSVKIFDTKVSNFLTLWQITPSKDVLLMVWFGISVIIHQQVNQVGHVANAHIAIAVDVSPSGHLFSVKQHVDEFSRVTDGNVAVAIDVTNG